MSTAEDIADPENWVTVESPAGTTYMRTAQDQVQGTIVADLGDDGIITFYKVPEGEYILKQIETNSKYRFEEISKNVTVKAGETVEVTFVNSLIKNK